MLPPTSRKPCPTHPTRVDPRVCMWYDRIAHVDVHDVRSTSECGKTCRACACRFNDSRAWPHSRAAATPDHMASSRTGYTAGCPLQASHYPSGSPPSALGSMVRIAAAENSASTYLSGSMAAGVDVVSSLSMC